MTTWTFFGRILPERIPLSVELPEQTSNYNEFGLRYRIRVFIADSQFVAPVVVESGEPEIHTLRNLIENDIRIATDLVGYLRGASLDVDILGATSDAGPTVVFGITIPVLQGALSRNMSSIEADMYKVVAENTPARLVLADFREAIRTPVGTGFFCYRAIEAMMQTMKSHPDDKDGPAWDRLRSQLQVDRSAIDAIKAHADYPRHGKVQSISDADRAKVFRLTDEIVRRFLAYLRQGKSPLALSAFPTFMHP
jgi:hypothetical protein